MCISNVANELPKVPVTHGTLEKQCSIDRNFLLKLNEDVCNSDVYADAWGVASTENSEKLKARYTSLINVAEYRLSYLKAVEKMVDEDVTGAFTAGTFKNTFEKALKQQEEISSLQEKHKKLEDERIELMKRIVEKLSGKK